jgi:cytochrome b561
MAENAVEKYPGGVQAMHWLSGGSMLSCVGLILHVQSLPSWKECNPEEKASKMNSMFLHKSFGTLACALLIPRLAVRLASKIPPPPEGHFVEQMAGKASHLAMYGFAIAMPVTGVTMGYMGGKGLPFFTTTFKPASGEIGKAKDGKLAGKAYKLHKQLGWYFKWFVPVHVGAVGVHAVQGQNLLARITPFFK